MRTCVASFGFSRPEMHKYSLSYLSSCRGAENVDVYMYIDGVGAKKKQFRKLAEKYEGRFASGPHLVQRPGHWGLSKNILEGMRDLFKAGYELVILLEDDVLVSKDFLEFHWYCHENLDLEKHNVLCVAGYTKGPLDTGKLAPADEVIRLQAWYCPDGVSFNRSAWKLLSKHIGDAYYRHKAATIEGLRKIITKNEPGFAKKQWSTGRYKHLEQAGYLNALRAYYKKLIIVPARSRCQDIGTYGTHQRQKTYKGERLKDRETWKRSSWYSRCWKEDYECSGLTLVGKVGKKLEILGGGK